MGEKTQMKLLTWRKAWDVPSVDPDCLVVLTYAKFTKAPLSIEETIPRRSVTGTLPELRVDESVYTSTLGILGILRKEGYNADFNLNSIDHADTLAYVAMIEQKLRPGLLQNFWIDSGNYVNCTRPAYCKGFGLFRSYWDLPQMRNAIEGDLYFRGTGSSEEREISFYKDAKACITLLSGRLGTKEFFFGSTPTTLDAVVFSYLSILQKAPLASTELQNHLNACDNLGKYCARISQRYFKDSTSTPGYPSGTGQSDKTEEKSDSKERRNQIISVTVAVVAMVIYSVVMGVFSTKRGVRSGSRKTNFIEAEDMID